MISLVLCIFLFYGNALADTEVTMIGNPGSVQFPDNSVEDCFARSVWNMHYYNGRIYVGAGDLWRNRGPIDAWSFDSASMFQIEYTVDEEQVSVFRDYDGKLLIPGMDSRESWEYGNLYINDHGVWQKLRTIPRGIHVYDTAIFQGNIYVTISSDVYSAVLESVDMGQTWRVIGKIDFDAGSYGDMVALKDSLIIIGTTVDAADDGQLCVYSYANGKMETLTMPLFPGLENAHTFGKLTKFKNGVLYIGNHSTLFGNTSVYGRTPLFFLTNFRKGAKAIKQFESGDVRDIVVRGNTCYVLTASESNGVFRGYIYSSNNLNRWVKDAEFSVGALPHSFELLDGVFYVGLGNRWGYADVESGNIYRLDTDDTLVYKASSLITGSQTSATSIAPYSNYPNPFNPETWIPYQLKEDADVAIRIYSTTGQLVRYLDLGHRSAGLYADKNKAAHWDGANDAGEQVASGVYFYVINIGEFTARRKMLVVR